MISLISPALIIALSCPLLLREASVHSRELTVQAPVDEQASHFGDEATEQLPVGDFLEQHGLAAERTQGRAKNPWSPGALANWAATVSSSRAITSTWLRSRASSKSAFP